MRFTGGALADDLTMSYNGNQISGITEGVHALHSVLSDGICSYDANGNLVSNNYEGFAFQYNLLNLPQRITKTDKSGTMLATYSYYCDGTKYSVTDATGSSRIYAGNLVYLKRNGVQGLESAAFGGGRFRTSLVIGGITYIPDYFITDHLGSTRAIIENGQVTAQYNYYPYGGEWSTSSQLVSDDNRYKFSGKEDQSTLGAPIYDFHARSYTTKVPMFLQQDPKATDYYSISPYAYCAGDPINRIDPDGKRQWPVNPTFNGFNRRHSDDFGAPRSNNRKHQGIDINLGSGSDDLGAPVFATHDGIVSRVASYKDGNGGGNRVQITSQDGEVATFYMHLNDVDDNIQMGRTISEGALIGHIGGSGLGKSLHFAPHLHYELKLNGENVNPSVSKTELVDPQTFLRPIEGGTIEPIVVEEQVPKKTIFQTEPLILKPLNF